MTFLDWSYANPLTPGLSPVGGCPDLNGTGKGFQYVIELNRRKT